MKRLSYMLLLAVLATILLAILIFWISFPLRHKAVLMTYGIAFALIFVSLFLSYKSYLAGTSSTTSRQSEAMFRSLLESAPDAMVIINEKGSIVLVNQQTEKLFEYSREELINNTVELLIPAELKSVHTHHRMNYTREPKLRSMGAGLELEAVKKSGVRFPVEISLSPLQTETGTLISASVRDITYRKKAEDKFKGLLDAAPDATVIVNERGVIEMVNQQTENIFGYSRKELIGQAIEILIPQDVRKRHVGHRDHFVQHAKIREMGVGLELSAIRKDGSQFPVEISLSPIQMEEGMLISASVRDITDRKKVQESLIRLNEELEQRVVDRTDALIRSEKKFRALVENNDGIIELLDRELHVIYKSPSSEYITGWSTSEREKTGLLEQTHPDDMVAVSEAINKIINIPGSMHKILFRTRHKNGHYIWLEGIIKNMFDEASVGAIITNFQDVTERKNAENKIIQTQILLQSSIESSKNMIIFSVDKNYRYLYYNNEHIKGMEQSYATRPERGKSILDCITVERDRKKVTDPIDKALNGESHILIEEFGDLEKNYYESRYNPIINDMHETIGATVFTFNITARMVAEQLLKKSEAELEEKVRQRTEQLEMSHKEMEAFTYSVSHDLRAPLRGIIGFTSILEEEYAGKLDDEGKRIASIIKINTLKMGELIDELLDFSRIGKQEINKSVVDMDQTVKEIIDQVEIKNQNTKWKIHPLGNAHGDINTIRQVWINLIINAAKYSANREQPEIEIGTIAGNDDQVFFIKDNGVGFDEKYKEKLFKVFKRLHSSREFEGTGVGLAIVEKIISKHGGKVWAEGQVNRGAEFYFSLPNK